MSLITIRAATAAELTAYAASKRYAVETGGIVVDGVTVATDRESQAMLTGAAAYVATSGAASIRWKSAAGWVDLTAAQVTALATAVGAHVQAAFATEAEVDAAITAGTLTTTAEIDAAAWPPNGGA